MIQSGGDTHTFYQSRAAYVHTRRLGWLMCGVFLLGAIVAFVSGVKVWGTYTHVFTFYLKWQDALVALLWFFSLMTLCGSILILRFQHAVRVGYIKGVFSLVDSTSIAVRDISAENLASIFWILNASFWCFVVMLIGLVPVILIGWTLHTTPLLFSIVATGVAILLSIAGIVLSITLSIFIIVGGFGAVSLWQKLGLVYIYKLDAHTTLRCDGNILTVIYPDMPESMLDLNALSEGDKQLLLTLLHEHWLASDCLWTLAFDTAIEKHVEKIEAVPDVVLVP